VKINLQERARKEQKGSERVFLSPERKRERESGRGKLSFFSGPQNYPTQKKSTKTGRKTPGKTNTTRTTTLADKLQK